jgi:predicted nuclease of predicted toxin-antitoxin system
MGTLSSELASVARVSGQARVYIDANVPAGLVTFMRTELRWDALAVVEHDDLRRASDAAHFRMARQLQRTLITLDRDYLDDSGFPPEEGAGVLVLTAPQEHGLRTLLRRVARHVFVNGPLPLEGRKLHVHVDWDGSTD